MGLCVSVCATGRLSSRAGVPRSFTICSKPKVFHQSQTHRASLSREGLSLRRKRRRKLPAVARVSLSVPQGPNERWSMDFIHDQLATGRRFRFLTLVDDFTRQCLAIHVATSIGGTSVVAVLQRLDLSGRLPRAITLDNGLSLPAKPSTSGLNAPALLSIISSRTNRCRTPSSRASMAPSHPSRLLCLELP
jgi:transposase InsO family protein